MNAADFVPALLACVLCGACGRSTTSPQLETASNADARAPQTAAHSLPGSASHTKPVAGGIPPGGECADEGPSAEEEISAQASARIPLKAGLTLAHIWRRGDDEFECLEQITEVNSRGVLLTVSCSSGRHHVRRVCRSDLRDAFTTLTALHEDFPETFRGTVKFSLSQQSFVALRDKGETRHRYVSLYSDNDRTLKMHSDVDGALKNEGTSRFKVIVNDRAVELPVIEATRRSPDDARVIRVQVLDDERFALLLDYYMPGQNKFFITYTKISFPTDGGIEQRLAADKQLDVYGIYFDFGSDVLRPESEPVLREIAAALATHSTWTLLISGHTDSVGGDEANLDLSQRRSGAVRKALIERFGIEPARLSTAGHGASQPKASNDTVEGRALNRRVELIRP